MKSIIALLHIVLAVWAIINILSSSASNGAKILWTLFVLFFPVIGLIVWFFIGPKSGKNLI